MEKPPRWKKFLFPGFLALLIAGGIFGSMLATRDPQAHVHGPLDRLLWKKVDAFNFKLTGHHGRPVELAQFRGKVVVFSFGFTHCPNICPATLAHFSAIRKALPEAERDKVRFLFISVDPGRDTPERLAEYVPYFDPAFIGLTGTEPELEKVVYEYKASFAKGKPAKEDPKTYFVNHTADVFVIGPEGRWEISYPFEELPKTEMIAADITKLATRAK
jgi:protein SCO1/2